MINYVAADKFVIFFFELDLFLTKGFHLLLVLALFKYVSHGVFEAHLNGLLIMLSILALYLALDPLKADMVEVLRAVNAAKYDNKAKLDSEYHRVKNEIILSHIAQNHIRNSERDSLCAFFLSTSFSYLLSF